MRKIVDVYLWTACVHICVHAATASEKTEERETDTHWGGERETEREERERQQRRQHWVGFPVREPSPCLQFDTEKKAVAF